MDRKQTRAFEGFVTESGDALLRMATLLTTDPDLAEDVYRETTRRIPAIGAPGELELRDGYAGDEAMRRVRRFAATGWGSFRSMARRGPAVRPGRA